MFDTQEIDFTDFDFLKEPEPEEKLGAPQAPPLTRLMEKYTPRKFAQDILDVVFEEGGKEWLRIMLKEDPKGYAELLKRILPRNLQLDGIEGLTVTLIDRFGNAMAIDASGSHDQAASTAIGGDLPGLSPPQIATGGNLVTIHERAEDMK